MDITSYLLGKNAGGGGGGSTLQNDKSVTVTSNGSTTINPDEGYDGLKKVSLTTNVQPNLESKEVTITTNTTTNITPTQGKDGLSSVSVITNIPSPSGTINISANGTYNVTNYASAEVSVGGQPTKGVVFDDWNSDGFPTTATTIGMTTIPSNFFYVQYTNQTYFVSYLSNVIFNNGVTSIGNSCFYNQQKLTSVSLPETLTTISDTAFWNCTKLVLTSLPSSLTTIGGNAFNKCYKVNISQIPDGVTELPNLCFGQCSIKKISMNNVTKIYSTGNSYGAFYGNDMKQVWIGSAITSIGKYVFSANNAMEKIYINLPRATVEAMTDYQYAWMNDTSKTGIIVCNDDAGFIDKATFDAQVIT